jgi:mannose-6-phosphate isomerase
VACPYFTLDLMKVEAETLSLTTGGLTFHALTVIDGQAEVICGDERIALKRFESVVVPAASGAYQLRAAPACQLLKASVEPE